MTFRKSDKKTSRHFEKKEIDINIIHKTFNGNTVRYIETGQVDDPNSPIILFVHGAPGSSEVYFDYLSDTLLLNKAKLVSIDRLGYGYSKYGKATTSIEEQAALVDFVVSQYEFSKLIVVGHSYGGPISGKYTIDNPDRVDALVMVAPVNDPDSEKVFWFAYFGHWKLTRWTISKALRVATDEKFSHIEAIRKLEPDWSKIQTPVIHFHGTKDGIASFENVAFSQKHIPDSLLEVVEIAKGGHMIVWDDLELIRDRLLEELE